MISKNHIVDKIILFLIICLPLFDMLNGYMMTEFNLSVTHLVKFCLFVIVFLRILCFKITVLTALIYITMGVFFLGVFYSFFISGDIKLLFGDLLGVSKFFVWIAVFTYFDKIKNRLSFNDINRLFLVCYGIIVINILFGIFGFGYRLYPLYDTGIKGFFYSGNEFTFIFISTVSYFSYRYRMYKIKYHLFIAISLILAFLIGTKSAIISVFAIYLLIHFRTFLFFKLRKRTFKFLISLPFLILIFYNLIKNTAYFNNFILYRLELYKYNFITWALSRRDIVAKENWDLFIQNYDIFQTFFGKGMETFKNEYRLVELDFFDILFSHGYIGFVLYLIILIYIGYKININFEGNRYALFFYIFIVFILANLSGHILYSGIGGFLFGAVISLINIENDKKSTIHI